jgi:hypothetical protein
MCFDRGTGRRGAQRRQFPHGSDPDSGATQSGLFCAAPARHPHQRRRLQILTTRGVGAPHPPRSRRWRSTPSCVTAQARPASYTSVSARPSSELGTIDFGHAAHATPVCREALANAPLETLACPPRKPLFVRALACQAISTMPRCWTAALRRLQVLRKVTMF